jgi:hypothetical protein
MTSVLDEPWGEEYERIARNGIIEFDGSEKGPIPTAFIAATLKLCDEAARKFPMVCDSSASTTTRPTSSFLRKICTT